MNIEKKIYFFLFTLIFAFVVWSGPKILVGNINAFHESDYATSISNDTVDNDLISDKKDINESIKNNDRISGHEIEPYINISTMLFGLLLLLVFSAILFFNLYRNKIKINEELNLKNHEINILNDQLKNQNNLLSKSEMELKSANEAKDKFFSIIAHDLMNPNQALMGYAQLLNDDLEHFDNSEIKEISKSIYKTTICQQTLLQNLLTWARSHTGKIEFKPENFSLLEKISKSIQTLMPAAEQKKIEIKIEIEQKLKVYADPDMVRTVCRNLVSNALKFTHSNGLITISATKRDNSILTMIEDTGVGIADELLDSLFKPGSTVSKPGTSNEVGTGLGLLICQEFVGINGGEIWVESKINIGSKFYFTLPLEH